jgi:hypothetical protein
MSSWFRKCVIFAVIVLAPFARAAASDEAVNFSASEYLDIVKFLASDEMKGRAPGTPEMDQVANFIVEHFKAAGCKPGGVDGTWFQPFDIKRGKKLTEDDAKLEFSGVSLGTKVREDWIPFPFSGTGDVEGDLVFAGFGIDAPEYKWNDYENIDVTDKIVLIVRYEPRDEDAKAAFGGKPASRYAQFRTKAETAEKRKAKAVLVVNPPERTPAEDGLYKFDQRATNETYNIPMVHISPELANALLQHAKMPDLATVQKRLETERKPLSAEMKTRVTLKTGLKQNLIPAKNILAWLDGDGSTDEVVVVGAHYDHLGVAARSFQSKDETPLVHNGADDNASGTAGIMELAQAFAHGPKLRRNVLFIAFTGEELGLLGSKHYVEHPTIPLERIKMMTNFDMIGRLDLDRLTIYGSSSADELHDMVERAVAKVGIHCEVPKGRGSFDSRSDQAPFFQKKIPILFTFTGMHPQYHQPEDDWELIDSEGATKVLQVSYLVVRELANMKSGPAFVDYARPESESPAPTTQAAQAGADSHPGERPADAQQPSRPRVRLGIVPDYAQSEKGGLVVDSLMDGGAAAEAGIQKGDRIVRIADNKIADIYGYMAALRAMQPGQVVEIELERAGKSMTVKVTLKGSSTPRE